MTHPRESALPRRRDVLALLGLGAAAAQGLALGACRTRARTGGSSVSAREVAALLPRYEPRPALPPDIPGQGSIPDTYLRYPRELPRVNREKPGRGGPPIRTLQPRWGPTPPGLGRNAFLDAVNAELGVRVAPSVQDGAFYGAKLSAVLAARDVPELLVVPSWEVARSPRFSQAVAALFEDLTEPLSGESARAYPGLAAIPTAAWQHAVFDRRLAAVPLPDESPLPWALFYRRDLAHAAGVAAPRSIDELYAFGKALTAPGRGVWAFGNVYMMAQMLFGCPSPDAAGGWRRDIGGGLVHRYELPEYRHAIEFVARLYREGLVHPEVRESPWRNPKPLFNAGRILAYQDGLGAWGGLWREQARRTPGFDMQPVPLFAALGGAPRAWVREAPVCYTFVKKGLGRARVEELLRVLDWCAAPFGSREHELLAHGVEGRHFTRAADGSPVPTALGEREVAEQFLALGGRPRALVATDDLPTFVADYLGYARATLAQREPDLFEGIQLELPPRYVGQLLNMEPRFHDLVVGRRPLSELDALLREFRRYGGDEARAFLERVLADNGR